MKQKVIVVSEEHRARVAAIVAALPLEPVHEIIIQEKKKDRSIEQNSLYWKWLTIIGNELGESKEDIHERYKGKFLVHIYERDNPDYAEMMFTLRSVWHQGAKEEASKLQKYVVSLTSTTMATVAQMQEYLQNIERDAASLAIRLPHIDD